MGRLVEEIDDLDLKIKQTSEKYHATHTEFALKWNNQKLKEKKERIEKYKKELNKK